MFALQSINFDPVLSFCVYAVPLVVQLKQKLVVCVQLVCLQVAVKWCRKFENPSKYAQFFLRRNVLI